MVYTMLWAVWFAVFLGIESAALLDPHPGGTLSENIWRLFRIKDRRPRPVTLILHAAALILCTWLTLHLSFGIWPS
jgi:hypothetical protein